MMKLLLTLSIFVLLSLSTALKLKCEILKEFYCLVSCCPNVFFSSTVFFQILKKSEVPFAFCSSISILVWLIAADFISDQSYFLSLVSSNYSLLSVVLPFVLGIFLLEWWLVGNMVGDILSEPFLEILFLNNHRLTLSLRF